MKHFNCCCGCAVCQALKKIGLIKKCGKKGCCCGSAKTRKKR